MKLVFDKFKNVFLWGGKRKAKKWWSAEPKPDISCIIPSFPPFVYFSTENIRVQQ